MHNQVSINRLISLSVSGGKQRLEVDGAEPVKGTRRIIDPLQYRHHPLDNKSPGERVLSHVAVIIDCGTAVSLQAFEAQVPGAVYQTAPNAVPMHCTNVVIGRTAVLTRVTFTIMYSSIWPTSLPGT